MELGIESRAYRLTLKSVIACVDAMTSQPNARSAHPPHLGEVFDDQRTTKPKQCSYLKIINYKDS